MSASRSRLLLLVVVIGYLLLCLATTDLHQYFAYDEAIYLSQIYPGPALTFTAPRARGLQILIAPLGWFQAPVPAIRTYMLLVNALLMYVGFNSWIPVLRARAVAAAALFAVAWLPLFYATQVFPNLPVAFGALAAAGYLARYLYNGETAAAGNSTVPRIFAGTYGRSALFKCALAIALTAMVRPTEATFVTAGLVLAAFTPQIRELGRRWAALLLGLVVGWIPWLVEAQLRYGGIMARFHAASKNVGGGGVHLQNIRYQLGFTDGPTGGLLNYNLPVRGVVWWVLLILAALLLIGWALFGGRDSSRQNVDQQNVDQQNVDRTARFRRAGMVAALAGLASASQYLLFTMVLEARFLLPAYALLTVAMVAAVPSWRVPSARGERRTVAERLRFVSLALALVVFVVFAFWQIGIQGQVEAQQDKSRKAGVALVKAVQMKRLPRPCYITSDIAFPVIAFGAGCRGAIFHPHDLTVAVAQAPAEKGASANAPEVLVLTLANPSTTGVRPVPGSVRSLASQGAPGWWEFIASPSQVVWLK